MMYLWWYCDDPKKPTGRRIEEAIAAYRARFHAEPNEILVNPADAGARCLDVLICTGESQYITVQPNSYLVGRIEQL